ncbi:MAG: hypothetical protein JSW08_02460 [archaeon]|nr:MAG: hypothetical protein JSW08_02460 [archaeon]
MKKHDWFEDLKGTIRKFKNIDNAIACFKFKYEREMQLPQWVLGIGIAMLLSSNISSIIQSNSDFLKITGIVGYVVSLVLFLVGIILLIVLSNRQKKAMSYLYLEKDKKNKK